MGEVLLYLEIVWELWKVELENAWAWLVDLRRVW